MPSTGTLQPDALAGCQLCRKPRLQRHRPVNRHGPVRQVPKSKKSATRRNTDYIHKPTITATQTPVRTLSKIETRTITERDANGNVTSREITQMVLTLRAPDAVRTRLADKLVGSREELLADLKASDAQITYTRNIETAVRRYVAAKRNVDSARSDRLSSSVQTTSRPSFDCLTNRSAPHHRRTAHRRPGFYNRGETWYRGGCGRDNRPAAGPILSSHRTIHRVRQLVDEPAFTLTDSFPTRH